MKNVALLFLASLLISSNSAYAEDDFLGGEDTELGSALENDVFASDDSWRRKEQTTGKILSSFLSSRISASTAKNIENAEKVFCYTVDYAPADYNGYTLNDLAIKGSCGELSAEGIAVIKDALLSSTAVYSTNVDHCDISPKIMLRYIHGLDSTDVLLSYPCPSLTFFHGRDINTINAAPGKDILDQIVKAYGSISEKFLSPALFDQMVANGQVMTHEQKEIVRKMNTAEPLKKWNTQTNDNNTQQKPAEQKAPVVKKGWNRLK